MVSRPVTLGRPARRLARRAALAAVPPLRRLRAERDQLRAELARALDEASTAKIRAVELETAGAAPERHYDYLFIVTYGRSGSTLLQGILGSAPGVLIRGENNEALYRLFHYQSALAQMHGKYGNRTEPMTATDSWYGLDEWSREESLAALRALVVSTLLHPRDDTRVLGFKEIRWWRKDWAEYLEFVRALFPGARFVLNTRDHEQVAKSKWWAKKPNPLEVLAQYEQQLDTMAELLGPAAYRVHYDDYVADPGVLAGLFEWLGEPFDRAAVEAVMQVRHSA